jgi:hypothetical protein
LQEKVIQGSSGWAMVGVLGAGIVGAVGLLVGSETVQNTPWMVVAIAIGLGIDGLCWNGLTVGQSQHSQGGVAVWPLSGIDQDHGFPVGESADAPPYGVAQDQKL